jgi:small subunit ribosomal protein S20
LTSKSAEKQVRVASRRRLRNKSVRSEIKTGITRAEKLIFSGELEEAQKAVVAAVSSLDTAVSKGILHANNAARRKARLLKKLNQASAQAAVEPEPEPQPEAEAEAKAETKAKAEAKPKTKAKPKPRTRAKKAKAE